MKRQPLLFLVAIQFLTRLPVPHLEGFQDSWLSQSTRYFPLVGALVGWMGVAVWWISSKYFPPAVAVGLMMSASLLLTGAFHEDGFADVCDGFGGGRTRDAVLSIMKDSRIGAYGAIGIVMMLGLKWSILTTQPPAAFPAIVVGAHTASRWCTIGLIWKLRYVRTDADGKSRALAGNFGGADWLLSGVLGALALLPVFLLVSSGAVPRLAIGLLAALAFSAASTLAAGAYFRNRIGGYTGDCLGAAQQVADLGFLLAAFGTLAALQWTG
jgi:adenosylcobinamide-GDP ribazoletransferase